MSNFKEKIPSFIFGLLFGLIVAGGFFILKLDDYFKELNFYKKFSESLPTFNNTEKEKSYTVKEQNESVEKVEDKEKKIKSKKEISEKNKVVTIDSVAINSAHSDSMTIRSASLSDEIVVKKDELLETKTISIIYINTPAKASAKDSLLSKVSGVDNESNPVKMMSLEFWQSPLNFKGYKMSKYKMMLYGLKWAEGMKLFSLDAVTYLKAGNAVYQMDYTSDFNGYKQVTDLEILSKLK